MEKKSSKGLVVLVALMFLIILGLVGYICYDKGVFDSLLGKEEAKQEEKLSEEEVMKLHDSLITDSKAMGFYYERKVSIDGDNDSRIILEYAISNYLDSNNIKIDKDAYITVCGDDPSKYYLCSLLDDSDSPKEVNNESTKNMVLSKSVIDEYIKTIFATNKEFAYPEMMKVHTKNDWLDVYYNIDKKVYYLVQSRDDGTDIITSKLISYNESNNELVIIDKPIVCVSGIGGGGCRTNMLSFVADEVEQVNNNSKLLFSYSGHGVDDANGKEIIDGNKKYFNSEGTDKDGFNFNNIFADFESELNTYKHTFKKADDGKYYWYSSEIVNE